MKLRNPLIALGILVGLSAYVYVVEIRQGERKEKQKEAAEHLYHVQADDVTGFTLTHGGEKIQLEKVAGKWKIQQPRPADPDADAVDRIVRSLADLKIQHDLGKQADLASFHLKDPAQRLEIQATSKTPPPVLSLGDDAPTGGGTYARLGDSDKVLVVSGASALQSASFFTLRDKTFLKFDPSKLTACRISRGKEEIDLARAEGKWSLTAPVRAPADDPTVSDLLFALQRLTVTGFEEESPAEASLKDKGLKPPEIQVALDGGEWKGDKDLAFGKVESGALYALHPGTGALVKVSNSIETKLKSTVKDLRKKEVLPFSRFEIQRLRLTGAGKGPLELERKDEKEWKRISPSAGTVTEDVVDQLLSRLGDLKAASFVDHPGKDLGRYGLARPEARLEIWKKGQAADKPDVLEIGRKDSKGDVPMRDPEWPSVLLVPATQWDLAKAQVRQVAEVKPPPPPSPASGSAPPKKAAPAKGGSSTP